MITFEHATLTYAGASAPTLRDVTLEIPEGELALVVGATGCGKSTLLGLVNGHVPRFTGGLLQGSVSVDGRCTSEFQPRDFTDLVGVLGQDPARTFVADLVEDELAYVMENLGVAPDVMRRRVEDVVDLLGLNDLRYRSLQTLSAGQQQRVALGATLTAHPRVLVLDEPTSALDPAAAEELLAALTRLVHDTGVTVLLAEHRLERVIQYADRVVRISPYGTVDAGIPSEMMIDAPAVPPIVELARWAGWRPIPLTIRDARRAAAPLRQSLEGVLPETSFRSPGPLVSRLDNVAVRYGDVLALRNFTLDIAAGQVLAVMGRNGAGKSTLLSILAGLWKPSRGSVSVGGVDPYAATSADRVRRVGMVPQDPAILLYAATVGEEVAAVDHDAGLPPGSTQALLDQLDSSIDPSAHPRDLSEGQRLLVALAVILATKPDLVLLDEPTRGLDYQVKRRLIEVLADLADEGKAVVVSTHDVEVVAQVADRVVVLAEGELVTDGAARSVITHSPVFAPQIAKIMAPEGWMTVDELIDYGGISE